MFKIKQLSEDFVVKEIINLDLNSTGKYTYFKLTKKNFSTLKSIEILSKKLNVKKIGFAGLKDKHAVTEQLCSVQGISENKIAIYIQDKDSFIKTEFVGRGNIPISLGDHKGNYFEIIVRNISHLPEIKEEFINFFGEQRFSTYNAEIGELLIKRDFRKALELILLKHKNYEKIISPFLQNNNSISALRKLPKKLLFLYLNAFQSKLWNELANKYANKYEILPLVGFGVHHELLKSFTYKPQDFIFREFPELSLEGKERKTKVKVLNLKISKLENDDLNKGMKKIKIYFELPKGSYATEFIRQNFTVQ